MDDGPGVGPIVNDVLLEASTTPVVTVMPPTGGAHMDGGSIGPIVSDVGIGASTAQVISVTSPPGEVPAVGTVAMDGTDMHVD